MANTMTLLDTAVLSQHPLKKQIYKGMFEGQLPSLAENIPSETTPDFTYKYVRLTATDRPTFRNIGGSAGTYNPQFSDRVGSIKVIQDVITLDVEQEEVGTYIIDPVDARLQQYGIDSKALMNDIWINGDPTADETNPPGLSFILKNDGIFANQCVNANTLNTQTNDATMQTWLDEIEQAIQLCGGGMPDLMVMNRQTLLRFSSVLRRQKLLDTTRDQWGRLITRYNRDGIMFVDAGLKPENLLDATATNGQVMGNNTETSPFGDANTSSIYMIKTSGDMQGVRQMQVHGLKTKRLGQNPGNTAQVVVDARTTMGTFIPTRYSISALVGFVV